MACNYNAIREDNERRYGTDIGRVGPMLLAERYADRAHFIYELLQNAEDALARREGLKGSRAVSFHLDDRQLRVRHFGKPFDEGDVRGICGIGESTKDQNDIGRFGIGFKSVYAFTDRPEIHSGAEDFAIENFVWPVAAATVDREASETTLLMPFKSGDSTAPAEIASALRRLGCSALLFLRQVEEIEWKAEGLSGVYLRESTMIDTWVRRVVLIGQQEGQAEVDETWLVFSRPVTPERAEHTRYVEIAFRVNQDDPGRETLRRVEQSLLVVFFPTAVETHLGFLVQGPYRTTPSRDNVHRSDGWNKRLVEETASLLVRSLDWSRVHDLLDPGTLNCLPLDSTKFGEASMFAPVFARTKEVLSSEPLLPSFQGRHVPGGRALLARSQELRALFSPSQISQLLNEQEELQWLSPDITQDRAPQLYRYLVEELSIPEARPETMIPRLNKRFLEAQSDPWVQHLYEFLKGQPALRRRLEDLPLVRLEDGTHVPSRVGGQVQAFLAGTIKTGFPTVRASVCTSEAAQEFLRSLGLTEPDPVDDVIRNVLPRYRDKAADDLSECSYEADMRRVVTAFATDSKVRQEKLAAALKEIPFVRAIDAFGSAKRFCKPAEVYLATDRLKELFDGVMGVILVDDAYSCLRGEDVRDLLEACGAARYLRPVADSSLSWEERKALRAQAGHAETSGRYDSVTDWSLKGLDELLKLLPSFGIAERAKRANLLWDELGHLQDRRGRGVFTGEYIWTHYGNYRAALDSAFLRRLNSTAWVPDTNGELQRSDLVLFDKLGWRQDPFLQSKIRFRPPVIEQLAKEAGIEPGVLELLKKLGVTSASELKNRLGLKDEPENAEASDDAAGAHADSGPSSTLQAAGPAVSGSAGMRGDGDASRGSRQPGAGTNRQTEEGGAANGADTTGSSPVRGGTRGPGKTGGRPFISYVGTHPDEDERDPDGLDHEARLDLEARAIELVLSCEPEWRQTPTNNPGYDLVQVGEDGRTTYWCEVKAMTGSMKDRAVSLSRTQFESAQEHRDAYWLYIVEHAGNPEEARIVEIQDPAGKARTFTFDQGWVDVADVNRPELLPKVGEIEF